jgi:hypothetical protein
MRHPLGRSPDHKCSRSAISPPSLSTPTGGLHAAPARTRSASAGHAPISRTKTPPPKTIATPSRADDTITAATQPSAPNTIPQRTNSKIIPARKSLRDLISTPPNENPMMNPYMMQASKYRGVTAPSNP